MARSAIGLPDAIGQAGDSTGNTFFRRRLRPAIESVKEGESLTVALGQTGLFDTQYLAVLETGEVAGSLERTFLKLNEMAAEDARFALQNITTLITWALYVGYMVFMAFLIIRMYGAVYGNILGGR